MKSGFQQRRRGSCQDRSDSHTAIEHVHQRYTSVTKRDCRYWSTIAMGGQGFEFSYTGFGGGKGSGGGHGGEREQEKCGEHEQGHESGAASGGREPRFGQGCEKAHEVTLGVSWNLAKTLNTFDTTNHSSSTLQKSLHKTLQHCTHNYNALQQNITSLQQNTQL